MLQSVPAALTCELLAAGAGRHGQSGQGYAGQDDARGLGHDLPVDLDRLERRAPRRRHRGSDSP